MAFDAQAQLDGGSIQDAAQRIQRDYPRLAPGSFIPRDALDRLRVFARECGMIPDAVRVATSTDLVSVYRVALRDPDAALRTAAKVQARLVPPAFDPFPTPSPDAYAPQGRDPDAPSMADLMRAVREAVEPLEADLIALRATLADVAQKAALEALKANQPTRLEVQAYEAPPVPLGLVHRQTPRVIRYLARKRNVYLYGPAGSGKTTMAAQVAKAFGVKPYYAAKVDDAFELMGFINAGGYVSTAFRIAYEFGGVFLFDEFDASAAAAIVALNMALANGHCQFPDALVKRHPDFYCIAAGNTVCAGATELYQGRNQLDAASVDRFVFVEFAYDEQLERAIAPNTDWCAYVQALRAAAAEREIKVLITPRATIDGAECLLTGDSWAEAAEASVFKGLDPDTVAILRDAAAYAFKG